MLSRRFRGTGRCLLGLLAFALLFTLYAEYRSRWNLGSSTGVVPKTKYKLVIVVLSAPSHLEQRDGSRGSWLSKKYEGVKHLFVVGTQGLGLEQRETLAHEAKTHGDLLLLSDLQDAYDALTNKVLQAFSSVYEDYSFDFLLKCDDDSLVLVDKVLKELEKWQRGPDGKELYWGFFNGKAQVKRTGPWKETDWIFCDFYLPYALGGGYVLSHHLVQFIAQNSQILRHFNSEDVSVGLWLSPLLNIERKHDIRFDTEYRSRGCSNEYIVTHKQSPESMNTIYQTYEASGALCLKEVRHRNSYQYNWSVPPSQCCIREPGIP